MRKSYDFSKSIQNPYLEQSYKTSIYDFVLWVAEKTVFRGLTNLRKELLSHATGQVLEVGLGTGQNLRHYRNDIYLTGIEPEPVIEEICVSGSAEQLPFKNESFDTVVSTLVFCSISNYSQALLEAKRVLKPNGKLLLIEHVRKPGAVGFWQDLLTPLWMKIAGGCHLNRDLDKLISDSGLKVFEFRNLWNGLGRYWVLIK
jgi:ubiquinone/menaquinone biosynthesis C-methylase UbiE